MIQQSLRKCLIIACAVAGVSMSPMLSPPSFGQSKKKTPAAAPKSQKKPAAAPVVEDDPTPAAPVKGLNGLGNDALLGELSSRGLETLLVEAFKVAKIAPAQQDGFRALHGLRLLTDASGKKLSQEARQDLIKQVVAGLNSVLDQMNDPRKLMEASAILLTEGTSHDANLIEYWGETPATQARLRPVAQAVSTMYIKAEKAAAMERRGIEKRMHNVNDAKAAADWSALDELAGLAAYNRNMSAYFLALATPRQTDMATREKIVDDAVKGLADYDNEDSGVQTAIKSRVAKMQMAKGDYKAAKAAFDEVINQKTKPAADANDVSDAKYFSVLCDLQSGDVATAEKELDALVEWQQANIKNPEIVKRLSAANEMMRYRLALAESELSQEPEKSKFEKKAVDVLLKLSTDRPDLRTIIYEQLVERVGNSQPVKGMDPLLLTALMRKADSEQNLDKPNIKVLERGGEAARELIARAATDKSIDARQLESAYYYNASFMESAGKKVQAANGYMDFVTKFPKSSAAVGAFNAAGRLLILDLRKGPDKGEADVAAAYDRFVPIGVNPPYNHKDLAYDYAQRLRQQKPPKLREAATYYATVPPTDPRFLSARYFQMISLTNLLDERLPTKKPVVTGKDRDTLVAQVLQLGDEVKKAAAASVAKATDDKAKQSGRLKIAGATLIAAQMAGDEQKDSKKVLAILSTFENDTAGLTGIEGMANEVLFRRVKAYMDSGQDNEATATLLALLNKTGGQNGANIVLGLLQKLTENMKKAEAAGDATGMAQIAKNRALLSGRLVDWAATSKSEEVRKFIYSYSVFDAESKLLAGRLNKDGAMVKASEAAFQKLMEPNMVELYQKEIASNPKAQSSYKSFPYHTNVLLGLGLSEFELKDYKDAQHNLQLLVVNRKLGSEQTEKVDAATGESTFTDNDVFWEAWYKLLRCNVEIYKQDSSAKDSAEMFAQAKSGLKNLYIINRHPGGEQWAAEFEKLRGEIIPEFDPASIPVSNPTSQPTTAGATQPVAKNDIR